ncbi:MAG: alanine racemase [Clostridia bacterium]|nr:alanine racemase [Clostridia bacterium]
MRTWCDVSLDNLKHNIEQIKGKLSPNVKLCGIVKANAYGHGVEEIVYNLVQQGVDYLAVAFIDEAVEIRLCGFNQPILILGNTPKDTADQVVEYNITASVYNKETAQAISDEAVKQNKIAKIHIKIDTGMSRIGFLPTDESIAEIMEVSKLPNIEIEGIFTHFACSDSEDESATLKQYDKFMWVVGELEKQGLYIPVKHCCNSAAIVKYPNMHLDMVRAGIILYGMYPSDIDYDIDLKPLMNFKTSVINVKTIEAGQSISYGATFTAKDTMKIATIAVGYADGYSRLLSNCGRVLVNGQFANIVGRICMDQCMIDVTNVHNINIGDEVILFGADENETLPIEELAVKLGTINYELPCIINNRVPRCYTKDNKRIKIHNNLSVVKSL